MSEFFLLGAAIAGAWPATALPSPNDEGLCDAAFFPFLASGLILDAIRATSDHPAAPSCARASYHRGMKAEASLG